MIAISSYRPFGESAESDRNLLMAKSTWDLAGWTSVYVGPKDDRLSGKNTIFLNQPEWPKPCRIKYLCGIAEKLSKIWGWVALVNGDIRVSQKSASLDSELNKVSAKCGYSLRYVPGENNIRDLGLDFFVGNSEVWSKIAPIFPNEYQIGKYRWDTSMLGHMITLFRDSLWDITPSRLIFHPVHKSRIDQSMETPPGDGYFARATWSTNKLIF